MPVLYHAFPLFQVSYVPVPNRLTFMTRTDELCGSYTYIAYSHGYLLQHHRYNMLSVVTNENFGVHWYISK